jgi:hypothetical protein
MGGDNLISVAEKRIIQVFLVVPFSFLQMFPVFSFVPWACTLCGEIPLFFSRCYSKTMAQAAGEGVLEFLLQSGICLSLCLLQSGMGNGSLSVLFK